MTKLAAFVRLSRPLFLFGGVAGVALGAAVAASTGLRLDVMTYVWVQGLVTAFQLMVHYANDYFDRAADVHARRGALSGGSGVLVDGMLAPRVALSAALTCALLGLVAVARFALAANVTVAWLGIAIVVFAWCYSAPPVRFAARGLGELDTALVVAVLVPFAACAAFGGRLDGPIFNAVIAPAAAMFAMMLCVELPDADADMLAGKRNLAVIVEPARTWRIIAVAAIVALASAIGSAYKLHPGISMLALAPAAGAGFALLRRIHVDPRPASLAFWGVALFATITAGLAAFYAFLPPR